MNLDLNKLSIDAYTLLFFVLSCLGGGVMLIYVYFHQLFISLDNYRLTVFAFGVTSPILFVNLLIYGGFENAIFRVNNKKQNTLWVVIASLLCSMPIMYLCILIGFIFRLTGNSSIIVIAIEEVIFIILMAIITARAYSQYAKL